MICQLSKRMDRDSLAFLPFFFLSPPLCHSPSLFLSTFFFTYSSILQHSPNLPSLIANSDIVCSLLYSGHLQKTKTQLGNETIHRPLCPNNTLERTLTTPSASCSSVPSPSPQFQLYRRQWSEPSISSRRRGSNSTSRRKSGRLCVDVEGDV